jgi:hypothetical protein
MVSFEIVRREDFSDVTHLLEIRRRAGTIALVIRVWRMTIRNSSSASPTRAAR